MPPLMNIDQFVEQLRPSALGKPKTLYATYYLARMCLERGVQGDFVECGVFAGVHPALMAYACLDAKQTRKIHLFDSFQGIPRPDANDQRDICGLLGPGNGELESTGISSCSRSVVASNMQRWGIPQSMLMYHEGWFQDTVPKADISIAMLRLDGDLYASTKVCLEHLYPKVNHNGWCIVDDYHLHGCRKAVTEYFDGAPGVVYWIPEAV